MRRKIFTIGTSVVAMAFLSACSANDARLAQFDRFAAAGQSYSKSIVTLMDASVDTVLSTDSADLRTVRKNNPDPEERKAFLLELDELMRDRMAILSAIKRSTKLLSAYFNSLAALSNDEEGAKAVELENGIAASASKLGVELAKFANDFGGKASSDNAKTLLDSAVPVAVRTYRRAKLDKVLEETAPSVGEAIDIHSALLIELGDQITAEKRLANEVAYTVDVVTPYKSQGSLPGNWDQTRKTHLLEEFSIVQLEEALNASSQMKQAFLALVENRADGPSFDLILQDIRDLAVFAAQFSDQTS